MFLWWCGCVFAVVFLCLRGGVGVFLRLCFSVFVVARFFVVFFFCGGVFAVALLLREALESCRKALEKSVGGECCRRVL